MTAIEATDSGARPPTVLELLDSADLLAAQVGPNIVVFSRDGQTIASGSARAAESAVVRIVAGDLQPGKDYVLKTAGNSLKLTASPAGTIFARQVRVQAGQIIQLRRH